MKNASVIAEIWHLGWRDGHLGLVPQELVDARTEDSFLARSAARAGETTVAVIDGAIAGSIIVVDDEVEQVYVSAPHRGTGVAGVLIREDERRSGPTDIPRPGWPSLQAMSEPAPSTNEAGGTTRGRSFTP